MQPRTPGRLAAIGTMRELWLMGPTVDAGHMNNPEKAANALVEDSKWLLHAVHRRVPVRRGRLYRTDDLVYYNLDSSLRFVWRDDTQVKIAGQRMELEEAPYYFRQLSTTEAVLQIVVDVITSDAIWN